MIGAKPLRIKVEKVDGFIRVYDGARYFSLFGTQKYDVIYNRYFIYQKSGITYVFSHNFVTRKKH